MFKQVKWGDQICVLESQVWWEKEETEGTAAGFGGMKTVQVRDDIMK